jgi:RND family efflux transporter MFP subunit
MQSASSRVVAAIAVCASLLLAACEQQNKYVPPPPPQVTVTAPVRQPVTRYLEATGNTAAVNSANLVARVQGFLQEIRYKDGDLVKQGDVLFVIEPEPYKVKLQQAQAAEAGAEATLKQTEADFQRQQELVARQAASKQAYDQALSNRDNAQAKLKQSHADTQTAAINLGYTEVKAPFDGIVTARLVSIGELVGGGTTPTQLATIVQTSPIWVNFNINEQEVLRVREELRQQGISPRDIKNVPVEIGLQTDTGYPHRGTLDYVSPSVNQGTGTLAVRGILQNENRVLLPGYFVRVRIPEQRPRESLLVPDVALGSDQGGRYVLVVNKDNVVEQRKVEVGPVVGDLRVIESGVTADDRVIVVGLLRAVPGQKVDPQTQSTAASAAPAAK